MHREDIEKHLPHGSEIILLDQILSCGEDSVSGAATYRPENLIYRYPFSIAWAVEILGQLSGVFLSIKYHNKFRQGRLIKGKSLHAYHPEIPANQLLTLRSVLLRSSSEGTFIFYSEMLAEREKLFEGQITIIAK